ncbi:protein transport protein Sec16B isoform X2 [Brachyhypopomus gauderio]|uniref:protein transport protein Sec16B isoform X2 n=1 Tax=Brachyhypopomus gauderio TaxID=698409 RepID=UPI00404111F1
MMKSRGQSWYGPGSRYDTPGQSPRDRDDPHRPHHLGLGHHPPSDPRELEHQWPSPDLWYTQNLFSSRRPEQVPASNNLPQSSQSYGLNQARPHSRQAHDYHPQSYWGYREDYGYYDHGYYQGHYGYPDASGWRRQGGWKAEACPSRRQEEGWMGTTYTEQYGLENDGGQRDGGVSGRAHEEGMENGGRDVAGEVWDSGALAWSKTSGLSSSSYELSQYINGSEQADTPPVSHLEPETEPKTQGLFKFSVPHVAVSFGPSGQLVKVRPALASEGEPAQVELHSLEVILNGTCEQNEMRDFPGPLAREDLHKVDIINFALQMAETCLKDDTVVDASSAALLWRLLVLQCRQNGRIVGLDVTELLMQGVQSLSVCEADGDTGSLIDLSETPTPETECLDAANLLTGNPLTTAENSKQSLQMYTKLVLEGRKKESLELAMRSGLWGHALFLASKMDGRTYSSVLNRFTGSLVSSDPLQTLFQLLSGRVPVVSMCYSREKWGDWRPHLAIVLSNEMGDSDIRDRFLVTMGDTLASRGLLNAAHICFLLAGLPFGWYTNRTHRLVLLGSTQTASFNKFCQNSAIRCTEVLEYCRRLEDTSYIIPSFQVYKFLYACRLLDCGLISQAFHYCEVLAKALVRIPEAHMTLLQEVIKLADRLKHSEVQPGDPGATGADPDPAWLVELQHHLRALQMGDCGGSGPSDCAWSREQADLTPSVLFTGETHTSTPQASCNSSDEDQHEKIEYIAQTNPSQEQSYPSYPSQEQSYPSHPSQEQSYPSYPSQEQSYPSYPSQEQSYPSHPSQEQIYSPAVQMYILGGQFPQTSAPVPNYPLQNALAAPPGQPLGQPGFPPVAEGQDRPCMPETSHHHTTTGLLPESCSDADVGFPAGANITDASEDGAALGGVGQDTPSPPEADVREANLTQTVKAPKSGWFSGWFRSKPKEPTQDQSKKAEPAPTSTLTPSFPKPGQPGPVVPPNMPLSQPIAAGANPFSRRAGQNPGITVGQRSKVIGLMKHEQRGVNLGFKSQSPAGSSNAAPCVGQSSV